MTPQLIAHRGVSQQAPENTLTAFSMAKALGFNWCECDVQLSCDRVPIVFHDATLERTSNGTGKVCDHPLKALQALDAGSWFDPKFQHERIPTLQALVESAHHQRLNLNIEIKENQPDALIPVLAKTLKSATIDLLVSSFDTSALFAFKQLMPDCPLALLIDENTTLNHESIQKIYQQLNCQALHMSVELWRSTQNWDFAKHIALYTVNDFGEAKRLLQEVDSLFTDNAALLPLNKL